MDIRLHIRGVSAAKCALLAIAISAQNVQAESPDPFLDGPASPFLDVMRQAAEAASLPDGTIAPPDPFEEACFSGPDPIERRARESSMLIVASYGGKYAVHGSGTVINGSGQGGPDRILTAAHVAPPFMEVEGDRLPLDEILAFSSDGRLEAFLTPLISGDADLSSASLGPSEVAKDMAVLEVDYFTHDAAEMDWGYRGAKIADRQFENLIVLTGAPTSRAFNKGMSGAGVFDAAGEIIGVTSFAYWSNDEVTASQDTGFISNIFDDLTGYDRFWASRYLEKSLQGMEEGGVFLDRSGGALLSVPVVDPVIRGALGLAQESVLLADETTGKIAGYPSLDCRVADVSIRPVPEWRAAIELPAP